MADIPVAKHSMIHRMPVLAGESVNRDIAGFLMREGRDSEGTLDCMAL